MLILLAGLPGTGKTTLGKNLSVELDAIHLNSDVIRKSHLEKRTYSEEEKQLVYEKLFDETEKEIKQGKNVIIDATFYREKLRDNAIEIAKRNNVEYFILKCNLDEKILKKRIESRKDSESEANFEIYKKINRKFEEIKEEYLEIDCSRKIEEQIQEALNYLIIQKFSKKFKLIQTHISWVFLTGKHVYKVKKPVKFSFLDFSNLEKRKFYCEEELRLNKRLAPEIYLEVVPVTIKKGEINFGNDGKVIEYAIKMKEISQENRMDRMLDDGKITEEQIKEIAKIVSDFHRIIDVIEDKRYNSPEMFLEQFNDLGSVGREFEEVFGFGKRIDGFIEKTNEFISKNKELMEKRQKERKIRECHGDLHTGNIFITDKPIIFDCIEFNKEFRYTDIVADVAFMAMDLDAQKREDLSNLFVDDYIKLSNDWELKKLLNLYKAYRANVRAKVAALEYRFSPNENSRENMEKYLELAEKYVKQYE